jgi:sterol desaturase/sphingolipid hydroxylase (fatty acid hydroxylase superfamily)
MRRLIDYSDFITTPIAIVVVAVAMPAFRVVHVIDIVLGVLTWTFFEYWLHRALHWRRFSMGFALHMGHHQHPSDPSGGTLYSTMVIGALVLIAWKFGVGSFVIGVLLGYMWFIVLHHLLHNLINVDGLIIRALAENHEIHHHEGPQRMFGVSTSLWDLVFGTA